MNTIGAGGASSSFAISSSYSSYDMGISSASSASSGISTTDSASLSFVDGGGSEGKAELSQNLNQLQAQKSQAEGELGELKSQVDEAQSQINNRKEEITKEQQGDDAASEAAQQYEEAKAEYDTAQTAKNEAQQELTQAKQENCANEQAINTNAQARQTNASNLSAAQSELASLQPPAQPSGDDKEAQANYQAQLADYNAKKSELEAKINSLNQEKQQLESENQQLQATKSQLEQTMQTAQAEVETQDAAMQEAQAKMDEAQQAQMDENPELQSAIEEDTELQEMQSQIEELQQSQAEKEAEISEIDAQIAALEAQDEALQATRAEAAQNEFQEAAEAAGADIAGSTEATQNNIAQEQYGKNYDELSDDEKKAIDASVTGEVTRETMEWAREQLKNDPDNEAAKELLLKGQQSLEAEESLAFARLSNSIEKLPDDLAAGANEAVNAAIEAAEANGQDSDAAASEAIFNYIKEQAANGDLSDEDKAAMMELGLNNEAFVDAAVRSEDGLGTLEDVGLVSREDNIAKDPHNGERLLKGAIKLGKYNDKMYGAFGKKYGDNVDFFSSYARSQMHGNDEITTMRDSMNTAKTANLGFRGAARLGLGAVETIDGIKNGDGWETASGVGNLADGVNDSAAVARRLYDAGKVTLNSGALDAVDIGSNGVSGVLGLASGFHELSEAYADGDWKKGLGGAKDVAEGAKTLANGVSTFAETGAGEAVITKIASAAGTTANAGKVASVAGTAAKGLGVAGAALAVGEGVYEIVDGAKKGDKLEVASGALGVAAGVATGAMVLGCAFPPLLIVGAICTVGKIGLDIYRANH